jgi:metal-responsive CopG/Arc/MetJ family transcriptional regulator
VLQKQTQEKMRIQFDLTPTMAELLDRLVEETGAATRAAVMRRAISIFALLWDENREGKRIELVQPKSNVRERVLLG